MFLLGFTFYDRQFIQCRYQTVRPPKSGFLARDRTFLFLFLKFGILNYSLFIFGY